MGISSHILTFNPTALILPRSRRAGGGPLAAAYIILVEDRTIADPLVISTWVTRMRPCVEGSPRIMIKVHASDSGFGFREAACIPLLKTGRDFESSSNSNSGTASS